MATKTEWAKGLRAPQGMARDADGNVYVAEYKGGQIAKLSPQGKLLAHLGTGLKNPAWITRAGDSFFISERKANRVLKMDRQGILTPFGAAIEEPLGLAVDEAGVLRVIAHTTSRLLASPRKAVGTPAASSDFEWQQLYAAPSEEGKRYGYRCIAIDADGTTFITDETEGQLLMLTARGRVASWVKGLDDPTGVAISPSGEVFVAEEGAGRISRIDANGTPVVVAQGLGQPRDMEFLDEKTMLVSDQGGGVIWRVTLP